MASAARKARRMANNSVVDLDKYRPDKFEIRSVVPVTANQDRAFQAYAAGKCLHLTGCAGTGKTFIGLYLALRDAEATGRRVILVRSAVPTRAQGFLPGDPEEKADVYEAPYRAMCAELYRRKDAYTHLKRTGLLEFTTTSYVRGMTWDNTVVLMDEAANYTMHEADSVVTRLGQNCTLVVAGDFVQTDFTRADERAGYREFTRILGRMKSFETVDFGVDDICRGSLMKEYIVERDRLGIQP
jgi:phosphate starvation-inducible protein PhoH